MNPSVHGNGLSAAIRSTPPISSQAACHALGAKVLTSMSFRDAMWTDDFAQVDGSSSR